MRRSFVKPAKKNPKYWEIEINGESYTITDGAVSTATKDFANEAKCIISASSQIDKIRKKGYMETLPEYSEWFDDKKEYAIWRNTKAVEFIIKTVVENSTVSTKRDKTQKDADDALNEIFSVVKDLEIYMSFDTVRVRMMALNKHPYELNLYFDMDMFSVRTPYWAMNYDSVSLIPNEKFKQLIVDFLNENHKGKWLDKDQKEESPVNQATEEKAAEAYISKLKSAVNREFKSTSPNLAIELSILETKISFISIAGDVEKDIAPVIFECAKSKLKKSYEETLTKAYYMLYDMEKQLPLASLKSAFDGLRDDKDISIDDLYKDIVFENWEDPKFLKIPAIDPTNKDDIKNAVAYIAENIESFILQTKFLKKYIQVRDKNNKKDELLDETDFFKLTAQYPELEEYIATIVEKLAEHNKSYPTYFDYVGSTDDMPIPVGATAAATLAMYDNKYDKLIATFLNTIKNMEWYSVSCSTMRALWREHNVSPEVPKTISVMTERS